MALADYARLKSWMAQSKMQAENNSLYQAIIGLIDGVEGLQSEEETDFTTLQNLINSLSSINLVEIDTSGGPTSKDLLNYNGMVIFKDKTGNAAANNITLNGTVEGVVNPVINTNFGIYKFYKSPNDGSFHTW